MSTQVETIFDLKFIKNIVNKVILFYKKRADYKQKQKIIFNFFNVNTPCPKEVKNCQKLREEYKQTIETLKKVDICRGCILTNVQHKYIQILHLHISVPK